MHKNLSSLYGSVVTKFTTRFSTHYFMYLHCCFPIPLSQRHYNKVRMLDLFYTNTRQFKKLSMI